MNLSFVTTTTAVVRTVAGVATSQALMAVSAAAGAAGVVRRAPRTAAVEPLQIVVGEGRAAPVRAARPDLRVVAPLSGAPS